MISEPPSRGRTQLWALVLDARSVPCRLEQDAGRWFLLVPVSHLDRAREELRLFEEENRDWPPAAPPVHPLVENTLSTLSILILLATFHNLTQLDGTLSAFSQPDWTGLGNAQAGKILDGQWWRIVTALTLHVDSLHLVSNLAIGGIFVIFLCRELGSGPAWCLLLGAGALGNLANAYAQSPDHSSVGASTAVFGAVGILAALSLVRYRQHLQRRWLLPFASALALLALLGTEGKNTDLGAHLFGFLFGIGLGLVAEYLLGKNGRPGRLLNALLAMLSAAVVIAAWWAALEFGG
nr:rhomboid family intramembrane serine protease [Geobacter sp. AOG2]